jgi:hypothetical protein
MNFGNLCLECYNLYKKNGGKSLPRSYDNNCNSTITCFKSPKGLFLPRYHLIYKVEILKTALPPILRVFFDGFLMLFCFYRRTALLIQNLSIN